VVRQSPVPHALPAANWNGGRVIAGQRVGFFDGMGIGTYYLRPRRLKMYIGGGVLLLILIILLIIFLL
jgi:hypothetical protein